MLPKVSYPIHTIKIPSLNKSYKFRPFLVKEEKLLLMAKESEQASDILSTIKQIVNNCLLDELDINKLAVFDLEYIFIKIRAVSVDNIVKLSYKDNEDQETYNFSVDLNKVEIVFDKTANNNIKITDTMGLVLRYPPASLYDDNDFLNLQNDYMFELIIRCVDKIYVEDTMYDSKDYSREEIGKFLEELDIKTFEGIQNFLLSSPKIEHVIVYKNKMGNERRIVLNSLNDFFTWR